MTQVQERTDEVRIEDALLMLRGARAIFERSPTAENKSTLLACAVELDYLLDHYKR